MLDMSGKALSRVTSSFIALGTDSSKNNLGLSLKFEAKSLKVIDYSRKNYRYWEFSDKTIELIQAYKVRMQTYSNEAMLIRTRLNSPKYFGSWTRKAIVSGTLLKCDYD